MLIRLIFFSPLVIGLSAGKKREKSGIRTISRWTHDSWPMRRRSDQQKLSADRFTIILGSLA